MADRCGDQSSRDIESLLLLDQKQETRFYGNALSHPLVKFPSNVPQQAIALDLEGDFAPVVQVAQV